MDILSTVDMLRSDGHSLFVTLASLGDSPMFPPFQGKLLSTRRQAAPHIARLGLAGPFSGKYLHAAQAGTSAITKPQW